MQPLPDRLPLVIGVTGHRDLREQDVPGWRRRSPASSRGLRRDYLKDDGETPIIVLSALAEGADRLVARVALAQGARLIAPLPLPVEEYRRDFEPGLRPGNGEEFDELLAQAIAAPVMPFTRGNSLEAVRTDPKKRAEQYRAVGPVHHPAQQRPDRDLGRRRKQHGGRRHRRGRQVHPRRHSARGQPLGARQPRRLRDRAGDPYHGAAPKEGSPAARGRGREMGPGRRAPPSWRAARPRGGRCRPIRRAPARNRARRHPGRAAGGGAARARRLGDVRGADRADAAIQSRAASLAADGQGARADGAELRLSVRRSRGQGVRAGRSRADGALARAALVTAVFHRRHLGDKCQVQFKRDWSCCSG